MKGTPQGVVGAVEKFEWTYTEVFSSSDKYRYDDGSGGYGYSVGEENELPLTCTDNSCIYFLARG